MLISQTPLRISFAGGGTDFAAYYRRQGGGVVSSAIDKFIYVILNQRFDDMIYLSYSKKEIVSSVDEIHHELVREAMRMAGVKKGVEIAIMADIPSEGSGLGSSSSLTVGLLNAFYAYRGMQVTAEQLAREACQIEIERCGKPIGVQDQYIAAYGGMRAFTFRPDDQVEAEDLSCGKTRQELSSRLLLFYTNKTRQANDILREQNARTDINVAALDLLRQQALACRSFVEQGALDRIGELMAQNWQVKKKLAATISNPDLDRMVETAHAGGATGCKICGAGGGGFLLVYCRPEKQDALRHAMAGYREMPFFLERSGSKVIFNVEGYEWK
jgi:D-glycero-alpha-D-manno-heptose-7-phosphate kinase